MLSLRHGFSTNLMMPPHMGVASLKAFYSWKVLEVTAGSLMDFISVIMTMCGFAVLTRARSNNAIVPSKK